MTKNNFGRKGLILPYSLSFKVESQDKNLEARTEAEAGMLPAPVTCSACFLIASVGGASHSDLSLFTPTTSHENALQTYLLKAFS